MTTEPQAETERETIYRYEREPYYRQLETRIVDVGQSDRGTWVQLADSIFYPEGGGQPADHGRLLLDEDEALRVFDVQKADGPARHYLCPETADDDSDPRQKLVSGLDPGRLRAGISVRLELDWRRRFDHMQQHTAQHVLSAVAEDDFDWPTTSFHLGAEVCDIEVASRHCDAESLLRLEEAVAAAVRRDLAILAVRQSPEKVDADRVRSRGLPENHRGSIRLVTISGLDVSTCGGTHLRSTGEIESLKILDASPLRGGTRITWVAGGRVRRRLGCHEQRNARLRKVLGAADDELVAIATTKLEQLDEARKSLKRAEARWAGAAADALVARIDGAHEASADGPPPVHAHFDGVAAGPMGQVARGAVARRPAALVVTTSEQAGSLFFVVAKGSASGADVGELGRAVSEALGGRGGGKGQFFQGRGPCPEPGDDSSSVTERLAPLLERSW